MPGGLRQRSYSDLSIEEGERYVRYETVGEAAVRLGVNVRTVQKWAASGKLPGAVKAGRDWQIPVSKEQLAEHAVCRVHNPMPLLNSAFPLGKCTRYIAQMKEKEEQDIAWGEYYYFSGQAEKAAKKVELYLNSQEDTLRYSAAWIYAFSNLTCDKIALTQYAIEIIKRDMLEKKKELELPEQKAMRVFVYTAATVLLHLTVEQDIEPLEQYLRYLPGGLKVFGGYVLAHKAYLNKNYERTLAIADMTLALSDAVYPIPTIYMYNIKAMAMMNLMRVDEAKKCFMKAWDYARQDRLIEVFAEHHGLLQGMVEVCLKENEPEAFQEIADIVYRFSAGWRKVHKIEERREIADNLSTTEFTVAMLYNRKWTIKEIAHHMGVSERTIRKHLDVIYDKLDIHSRQELEKYMLK